MMCMSGRIFVCLPFMLRICFSPLDIPCATFWEVWIFHFLFAFDFFSVFCDFDNLVTACCDSKTVSESDRVLHTIPAHESVDTVEVTGSPS